MSAYDMSIHTNPDATAWARFYVETRERFTAEGRPGRFDDEENMVGWFANAMMAMHDHLTGERVTVLPDGSAFFAATVPDTAAKG
jgi:hypothetical protein